jgi:cysteinyl-tRNA synthetase
MLRLFDSVAGEVRELVPRDEGRFSMYVCGPTVNDLPHIGHGRFALVWDVVRRWIAWGGLDVDYVSNITDVDDKIIARARLEGRSEAEVTAQYEAEWFLAMDAIGVARPTHVPHATAYIEGMVALIEELLVIGAAYQTSDGVYFDVNAAPDYGVLAGQPLDSLRAGARVETVDEKRSPLDFALWKLAKPEEISWETPFGRGRPGWHTECVVMSTDLLGDGFDLHTGGFDLKFPHHENERAQAVALGRKFARRWAHNGFVMSGGVKMSNSLNNFTSLTDLLTRVDQRAYRLLVLRSHYRSPLDVAPTSIADAERALERLDSLARRFDLPAMAGTTIEVASRHQFAPSTEDLVRRVSDCMDDDLDTPGAVAALFEAVTAAHAKQDEGDETGARELASAINALLGAMGLGLRSGESVDATTAALVARRDAARAAKDWSAADALRDELVNAGWSVEDGPKGTIVRK